MARVTVYSTAHCAFCTRAKVMLEKWGIDYDEVRIDRDNAAMKEFVEVTNGDR